MIPAPFAPPADRQAPPGHHPLAYCEWCSRPVPGILADYPDPDCQRKALDLDMWHVRREDA